MKVLTTKVLHSAKAFSQRHRHAVPLAAITAFALVSGCAAYYVKAATSTATLEAENTTIVAPAAIKADQTASNGSYLEFGVTTPPSTDPTIAAAGDIADGVQASVDTANMILGDKTLSAVLALGDLAYPNGSRSDFTNKWKPTWGQFDQLIWPTPGNHDYYTKPPYYYTYFNNKFAKWWSADLGNWHIVSMNSQEDHSSTSAQVAWLKADLAAHPNKCTLAFAHYPRWSFGSDHGNNSGMQPLWQVLYDNNVDVVLNGHSHNYQRFHPLNKSGAIDTTRGVQQFIVGTGGDDTLKDITSPGATLATYANDTYGILKMTLHPTTYDWSFISTAGVTIDSGTGTCH